MSKELGSIVDFLFETGILAKTPRSGFHFLGSGEQSVAEHINRVVFIGYVLTTMEQDANSEKVLKMCLFHDLTESRTSDLNYVHQKYASADHHRVIEDLEKELSFGSEIRTLFDEYEKRESLESKLAKDADVLEWVLSLKEQVDAGNKRAETWIPSAVKRLHSEAAKSLVKGILVTNSDHWWFADKEDGWWVDRKRSSPAKE